MPAPPPKPWLAAMLLALGVLLWFGVLWAGDNGSMAIRLFTSLQLKLLGLAVVVLLIGKLRRPLFAAMEHLRNPSSRARWITAFLVTFVAAGYLFGTALYQSRDFFPKLHDEHMHLVQMQLLAQGRLWLPAHPLADFFETFHIFAKPVYAPLHFPGTSLLYVPAIWFHLPTWLLPLVVASITVGLVYLLFTELIDGVAGILGAVLMLSLAPFRYVSLMVLSNPVSLLLGLLMIWCWLRWRERKAVGWALAIGIFTGLAAITRPPDALCFAIPIGVAMVADLWGKPLWHGLPAHVPGSKTWAGSPCHSEHRRDPKLLIITTAALLAGAAPFLALQLAFDRGVTGHWLQTPHDAYSRQFNPGVNYGVREPDLTREPQTSLPQKQIYYATFVKPFIAMHRPAEIGRIVLHLWLPTGVRTALPAAALLVLLPLGLLGLTDPRRRVLALILPLGFAFYALSVMISWYYLLFAAPAVLMCVLLGAKELELTWPAARAWIAPATTLLILAFALAALPEVRGESMDEYVAPTIAAAREKLAEIHEPAIVLFRFQPGDNVHEEPVYNIDTANPDDAAIIRAHDFGPRNIELFRYYAQRQPDRVVYRFDRHSLTMERLGNVRDLSVVAGGPLSVDEPSLRTEPLR